MFPPIREKSGVPSIVWRAASKPAWCAASSPIKRSRMGPMRVPRIVATPPTGNARTSWVPVLAPLGAPMLARPPSSVTTVASTVSFPRLS